MSKLFEPLKIRGVEFRNKIFMSPMCQYSAIDGVPQDWHHVHYVTRAMGGVSLVMFEASGVTPEGRITPSCLGIWSDKHAEKMQPTIKMIHSFGSKAGIQLAHAGRKGSMEIPWSAKKGQPVTDQNGWTPIAPSAAAYSKEYLVPREMTLDDIEQTKNAFVQAAQRSVQAGFDVIELHMAHGYLIHEFFSPLSNFRDDQYGGSFENRIRFAVECTQAVRKSIPESVPLFVRISATDWVEGGWDLSDSIKLSQNLKMHGADLIDVSSGGLSPMQKITDEPLYQVSMCRDIRKNADVRTAAVGMITTANEAEGILQREEADAIFLGRALLRNPYWTLDAFEHLKPSELHYKEIWPPQYWRGR